MTIQGAINELVNLLKADDIPIYYKGGIKKVIETIDDYVKRRIEPQTDCNGCKFVGTYDTEFPCAICARKTKDYYEPQTERSE